MAKSYKLLLAKMAPHRRRKNQLAANKMITQIALKSLRKSLNLTQVELAKALKINQASISKLEAQDDMYISTLSRFVAAMGGQLKLVATFNNKEVILSQFSKN